MGWMPTSALTEVEGGTRRATDTNIKPNTRKEVDRQRRVYMVKSPLGLQGRWSPGAW
jgi:hypothetical protein